jgi:hypothetical protein
MLTTERLAVTPKPRAPRPRPGFCKGSAIANPERKSLEANVMQRRPARSADEEAVLKRDRS